MKAKDFIPPSKPRNPVVRQQQTSGAGTHKDKKKAQKQGDVKHKKRMFDEDQGVAESTSVTDYNPKSQGGTRKELLAKYHKTKDPKDAEAARKAGATQKELQGVAEGKETINIGDDVVIVGNSAYAGVTGRVIGFREGKIVVDMLEQGKVRFAPERVKLYPLNKQGVAEISKPAMARYVKAAGKDVEQRASSQSFKSGQAGDKYNKADPTHKDTRREKGIDRALGRLSK